MSLKIAQPTYLMPAKNRGLVIPLAPRQGIARFGIRISGVFEQMIVQFERNNAHAFRTHGIILILCPKATTIALNL
jgi:hypothetical protein